MLNFVYILAILSEIILCTMCVVQLIKLEKRVLELNEKLFLIQDAVLDVNKKIKDIIIKINKVVSIFKNKKFIAIKRILKITMNTIQVVIFLRSLDFSKGLKSINYKNIKKILYAEAIRRIIVKTLDFMKDYGAYCKQEGK